MAPSGSPTEPHDGTGRVQLAFTVLDGPSSGTAPPVRTFRVPPGVTVFDAGSWNGIAIDSTCGGHGTCHKCKVQLDVQTTVSRHDRRTFSEAELAAGWRLACLATATQDLAVTVPPLTTRPKAATVGVGRQVILRPAVQKRYVELADPSLQDQRTDLVRLTDAIDDLELTVDLHVLRRLPKVLREADFKVTAVIVDEALVDVEPGDTTEQRYAIAFDLGTTTVVATLLDLTTGTPVAVASRLNKQQPFGGDVITRISATMMDPDALGRLQKLAAETLDELAAEVCTEGGVAPEHVYEVAVAGNATMTALLLGIDPEPLGVAPFVMSTSHPPVVLAAEVGLHVHPRARLALFPALGVRRWRHRGGHARHRDGPRQAHAAVHRRRHQLRDRAEQRRHPGLDRGARGPAFEGGAIRCGMRRGRRRHRGRPARPAVGGGAAVGDRRRRGARAAAGRAWSTPSPSWCGWAARRARAGSCRSRPRPRWRPGWPTASPRSARSGSSCCTGPSRTPTSPRPSTSPSATCASCSSPRPRSRPAGRCCSSSSGSSTTTSSRCCSPGSFGSYLSPASAIRIGLVPKLPVLRIVSAGNVAGEGAKMALLSLRERAGATTLLEEVEYVELSDRPEFNDRFVDLLAFPT